MSTPKSNAEQKEIDKYIKFFATKALQSVVESRVGCKVKTKCNPAAKGLDWFNISLSDGPASGTVLKKVRELFGKKLPGISKPICVDIVLKTTDGSYTILESWQVTTDSLAAKENNNSKVRFSIYNRLGVLLRSVISVSRLLPSYNLSRKPQNDYMLFCKVHTNLYQLHDFELHNAVEIGSIVTNSGKVTAKVLYRNKIWLSGSFHAHTYNISDVESLFLLSAADDVKRRTVFESVDMIEKEIALAASDFESDLAKKFSTFSSSEDMHDGHIGDRDSHEDAGKTLLLPALSVGHIDEKTRPVAAFVEPTITNFNDIPDLEMSELSPTPPFMSLLNVNNPTAVSADENVLCGKEDSDKKEISGNKLLQAQRTAEAVGFEDDFVLVELRPAFCTDDDSVGTLYRQCQSPAMLDMFASLEKEDIESEPVNLDSQLERYQKELREYEDFFKILT